MQEENETEVASLSDLLKPENVRIIDSVRDWKDAVRISLKPLEDGGYVEPRYAENVIKDTIELGPYYVLTDDVALIHARPEEGAIKKQLAVTLVHQPVVFNETSFPVRILFALAAEDSTSHIEVIKMLANFCMDESRVAAVTECTEPSDIYQILINSAE